MTITRKWPRVGQVWVKKGVESEGTQIPESWDKIVISSVDDLDGYVYPRAEIVSLNGAYRYPTIEYLQHHFEPIDG